MSRTGAISVETASATGFPVSREMSPAISGHVAEDYFACAEDVCSAFLERELAPRFLRGARLCDELFDFISRACWCATDFFASRRVIGDDFIFRRVVCGVLKKRIIC
jgi:hypothetical protein